MMMMLADLPSLLHQDHVCERLLPLIYADWFRILLLSMDLMMDRDHAVSNFGMPIAYVYTVYLE